MDRQIRHLTEHVQEIKVAVNTSTGAQVAGLANGMEIITAQAAGRETRLTEEFWNTLARVRDEIRHREEQPNQTRAGRAAGTHANYAYFLYEHRSRRIEGRC